MTKSHVSIGQAVCPVCGAVFDTNEILLDKHLRATLESRTITHYELCPEHAQLHKDGYIAFCAVAESPEAGTKKLNVQAKRTGSIAHLKREVVKQMFPDITDATLNGPLIFVEEAVITMLKEKMNYKEETNEN